MSLNLDYLYDFQKDRYSKIFDYELYCMNNLSVSEFSDCYLLPVRKSKGMVFGLGGCIDKNGKEIKESFILHGASDKVMLGGQYEFSHENLQTLKGEYVYLGYIWNHWGHFLVDFCTRLWYAKECKNKKMIFITMENMKYSFISQIRRFLELLDINVDNIIVCERPCLVEKMIIPQQSYQTKKYTSRQYLDMFDTVCSNIRPSIDYQKKDKIYFSRRKFGKAQQSEINVELMDNLFGNNDFSIVYPERLSLDDQIAMINDCKELAMISGTLVHNLLFVKGAKKNQTIYIMNKTYVVNYIALDTLKIKNIIPVMVDSYISKYPTSLGHGPFMLVANQCLHKFIEKYNLNSYDSVYDSDEYLSESVSKYDFLYYKINFLEPNKRFFEASDASSWSYFDSKNLYEWLYHFSKYEVMERKIYDLYNSHKEISDSLLYGKFIPSTRFRNIIDNKYFLYSVHISNFGWTNFSFSETYCGFLNTLNTIEAFVVKAGIALKYKCYYEDTGWSDFCGNDHICGSTGQRKKIQGLCITSDADNDSVFEYRIFSIKSGWSEFVVKGTEMISLDGFSAFEMRIS